MNRQPILFAALAVAIVCRASQADDELRFPAEPQVDRMPLVLSSRPTESRSDSERKIEIHLEIGRGYEIYAERKHAFLLPLKLEVLDQELQPIRTTIQYPDAKTIPLDRVLGGDYQAYRGNVKLIATCPTDAQVVYVRVSYHGNYKQQY